MFCLEHGWKPKVSTLMDAVTLRKGCDCRTAVDFKDDDAKAVIRDGSRMDDVVV